MRTAILSTLASAMVIAPLSCRPSPDARVPDRGEVSQPAQRHPTPVRAGPSEARQTNEQIRFRATVEDVVMLSSFSGAVMPVHIDPRFTLTVCMESATPEFAAGSVVTFGIHSPSLLFAGEDAKGKTYDFSVQRDREQGPTRYSLLEVSWKRAHQGNAENHFGVRD